MRTSFTAGITGIAMAATTVLDAAATTASGEEVSS